MTLTYLADASELIGLGDAVDESGLLPPESVTLALESIGRLAELAREAGAQRILVLGTEPLRRGTNADDLVDAAQTATGLTIDIISVQQEAQLTFLGVTAGRRPAQAMIAVDIGGGSTEVVLYQPDGAICVIALPTGSARLTNAIVHNDPPLPTEQAELLRAAARAVDSAHWPPVSKPGIERAVFVGGTGTNVAHIGPLDRSALPTYLEALSRQPAAEVMERYLVRPRRARQLSAGIAIVDALLARFGLEAAEVSDASLRDGAIIAGLAGGDAWPAALSDLLGQPPPRLG